MDIAKDFYFFEFIKTFNKCLTRGNLISITTDKNFKQQFFVIFLLNFLNQMTGINTLIMYSHNIFLKTGHDNSSFNLATVLIGKCTINLRRLERNWVSLCSLADQCVGEKRIDTLRTWNADCLLASYASLSDRILQNTGSNLCIVVCVFLCNLSRRHLIRVSD